MKKKFQRRNGALIVLVAILLVVIFILAAMAINIAYLDLCRAELRTATDSAARAAARKLAQSGSQSQARHAAKNAALENNVAGQPLSLSNSDIVFGNANRASSSSRYTFSPSSFGGPIPNAVSVEGKRVAGTAGGPIQLFFGNFLGMTTIDQTQSATATQAEIDILFVLDRSGSMAFEPHEIVNMIPAACDTNANGMWDPGEWNYGDPPPIPGLSRWEDVVNSTYNFLTLLNTTPTSERVAVVIFNHQNSTLVDFTSNYAGLMSILDDVSPTGATGIGDATLEGVNRFNVSPAHRSWASKVMVVLTDGQNNTGSDPIQAAQVARNAGITVHTIGFTSSASTATMESMADIGGGMYASASDSAQLNAAFKKIFDSLPVLLIE